MRTHHPPVNGSEAQREQRTLHTNGCLWFVSCLFKESLMDQNQDGPLQVRVFALDCFRLDPDSWRDSDSEVLNGFWSSQDQRRLFIHLQPDSGICAGLSFPPRVQSKVLCVSKTGPQDKSRTVLDLQEVEGGGGLSVLIGLTEEVTPFGPRPHQS